MEQQAISLFSIFLVHLPVLLVWLVGIILSLVFWGRHPKVSLLTLFALLGITVTSLVSAYLSVWLPASLYQRGVPTTQIGIILSAVSIVSSLLSAVFWILVIIAIFGWRKKRETLS